MTDKVTTGCAGLDQVLFGGIPVNTISVIMGAPGTGKTILAEQMAFANASLKKPVLYLTTMSEPLEKFIMHGQTYRFFDLSKIGESIFYEDLGLLLKEQGIEKLPELISDLFMERRPGLIFIDSFKALKDPAHGWAAGRFIHLTRNSLPRLGQARAQTLLRQPIDEQTEDHDQAERHDALGLGR